MSNDLEVTHIPFNPTPLSTTHSPLGDICNDWGRGGWRLVQVVPHHEYESVAVFVRGPVEDTFREQVNAFYRAITT
jgi:hypothetical protein